MSTIQKFKKGDIVEATVNSYKKVGDAYVAVPAKVIGMVFMIGHIKSLYPGVLPYKMLHLCILQSEAPGDNYGRVGDKMEAADSTCTLTKLKITLL
jgi:hypothetical protein